MYTQKQMNNMKKSVLVINQEIDNLSKQLGIATSDKEIDKCNETIYNSFYKNNRKLDKKVNETSIKAQILFLKSKLLLLEAKIDSYERQFDNSQLEK